MHWIKAHFGNIGGSLGSLYAMLLNIHLSNLVEIGLYALIGSVVGEAVKQIAEYLKKKKTKNEG